jgi:hypothetical protein
MIFTLGRKDIYEPLFVDPDKPPRKAKGGSVWQTWGGAEKHRLSMPKPNDFAVYGVGADWHSSQVRAEERGVEWRSLTVDAPLVRIAV